ncbi:MFS transporter [Alicyclobacillus sp. SO9]|uniref:MFS transporter n=1 Tax=Alicyclobacillus sp. SO9 TaxID=2665646 RepID=UPI0018E6EC83|nr:MFS transporter [Alicyclobacillus sp. SO9]QQE77071.1 MFS transporter [Alicyclobacillus sp. SO9]
MSQLKRSVFSNTRFLALLSGQGVSYLGDSIASVALPILILTLTKSGFLMGLVGALEVAPLFIVGLPAGVWVDRWSRTRVMLTADFGRAVLVALIPFAFLAHIAVMPVVFIVAAASGTLAVFFGAGYTGMIPHMVPAEKLGRANGYFEAIESLAYAVGPSIAGLLTTSIGPFYTMGLDGLSFFVSALSIMTLRRERATPVDSSSEKKNFYADMKVGFRTVLKDSVLKSVTLLWGSNRFVFAALIPTLTFFVLKTLHGTAQQVGVAVSVYAVGSLAGTLFASKIPVRFGMVTAFIGQGLMLVSALTLTAINSVSVLFACSAILGLGEGVLLVIYLTYRVSRVPDNVVGRVYSITSTATQGMGAIGYLVVGGLLSFWGGRITWFVLSVLSLAGIASSLVFLKKKPVVQDVT